MTAVVLLGFNRPDHIVRTLAAICAARPDHLFLVADGAREGNERDAEGCAQVRALMDAVEPDWPCEVHRLYRPRNYGCDGSVETGLDWVFSQVPEALIFEDDCVPDPTFFAYATELLERYRDDKRVWQISGNRHDVPTALFEGDSYRFAAWGSIWGWATWADRWQQHRAAFTRHPEQPDGHLPVRTPPAAPRPEMLVTRGGRAHFAEAAASDDVIRHNWDKHWWLTMMTEGALAATPSINLVENIGFGEGATHGVFDRTTEPAQPMPLPLQHPAVVALDAEVERELELLMSRIGGPGVVFARKVITHPKLRAVAREALHSKAAVSAVRFASRLRDRNVGK